MALYRLASFLTYTQLYSLSYMQEGNGFIVGLKLTDMKNIVVLSTGLLDVLRNTMLSSEFYDFCLIDQL